MSQLPTPPAGRPDTPEPPIREIVREHYAAAARHSAAGDYEQALRAEQQFDQPGYEANCCGTTGTTAVYGGHLYGDEAGETLAAALSASLGCGVPTAVADLHSGETVLDLGSGAGNDCFVARAETGETGQVIGVDFTDAMLLKARANALKLGYNNVSFVKGDIEHIPLPENTADVVVSNCVFNLVPNKQKAFQEAHRILKPGAHFSISDIVLEGELPAALQKDAELYAGCVAGAIQKDAYMDLLKKQGFQNLQVQKKKAIQLPEAVLAQHLNEEQIQDFNRSFGIFSITVYGEK